MSSSTELRDTFLNYFQDREHTIVAGSSLVPANDPSLLFTNSGMVQFKDIFLGIDKRSYQRATTAQPCLRAGGKHNDLDNVGYTARHHTFFEMLGNFSFGDYFKQEAILYAWEFLTKILDIPEHRLWVTVYEEDSDAAKLWRQIGVPKERLSYDADNFWSMGDTGPCGPCTEIFYDHGEQIAGDPPSVSNPEGDRYIEIWNIVFTQYNRDKNGNLSPIPSPSVDTGMGLERISSVMQGVHNNYDIDIFRYLIKSIRELAGSSSSDIVPMRVIADHIRACAFLIADGVLPGNEGRAYVLRRIIRRAIRHGNKLGLKKPFFYQLVNPLYEQMGDAYPILGKQLQRIRKILLAEEERFAETLELGLQHLENVINHLHGLTIGGAEVFKLYDTYGFPSDLTADIARERGLNIDIQGFNKAMQQQQQRSRSNSHFANRGSGKVGDTQLETNFTGYNLLQIKAIVQAIYRDAKPVTEINAGEVAEVILDSTNFYAESGGQVGDQGRLIGDSLLFEVTDTQKHGKAHVHTGKLIDGCLRIGHQVDCLIDQSRRQRIMRNHSATHLLHAALRKILGEHVCQQGSLVDDKHLRFDFSHSSALSREQINQIEEEVNQIIRQNRETVVESMSLDKAKASGALSLFGEKYGEKVRVLKIGGEYSTELCGGTHVVRAGDIGFMKIKTETGIAAGVRRLEAVTGEGALAWISETEGTISQITRLLKTDRGMILTKLRQQLEENRKMEKIIASLKEKYARNIGNDIAEYAEDIGGVKVIAKALDDADMSMLRNTVDQLKNKLRTAALVLASTEGNKVNLIAGVTDDSTDRINAGELVNFVAQQVGGKGGGRPDLAQAGGDDIASLDKALAGVSDWVRQQISV